MSVKAVGGKLLKHGTALIRHYYNREALTKIITQPVKSVVRPVPPHIQKTQAVLNNHYGLRNIVVRVSQQARRILIENGANRFTNRFGEELFQRAKQRGLYGHSGALLGLIGVTVASNTSILTKDEELEGVCWEIRQCMTKIQFNRDFADEEDAFTSTPIRFDSLSIGKPIDKGANAVVYAAKLASGNDSETAENSENIVAFPLAVKMLFNYDVQSNSVAIMKAMYRETVPARVYFNDHGFSDHEFEFLDRNRYLPPHPNIVKIFSVFTDFVPKLDKCRELYPAALPRRIDPNGIGRNMSLFLLMKRYHRNLEEFLRSTKPSVRTSVLLLAQLLEGISHMVDHNIAHRDLKSNNVLLDLSEPKTPLAVIGDFGCCLAEKRAGLTVPYASYDVDTGGNSALRAPEIRCAKPGPFNTLNYSKSDLWAAGAIAYEIFGLPNPFYQDRSDFGLNSGNYKESELPALPRNVPLVFNRLVKNLLRRDPNKRLSPEIAANVCQLYLWAPTAWLTDAEKLPTYEEILEWLLNLAAKILCEGKRFGKVSYNSVQEGKSGCITYAECMLISTFLRRAKLANIHSALNWIRDGAEL